MNNKFLVYEVRELRVFNDSKRHRSFILVAEFYDKELAEDFVEYQSCLGKKFVIK